MRNSIRFLKRNFYIELTYLRLVKLDISGNRISVLPNEMRKMKGLVDFRLSDNPLTSPPASVSIRKRFIRSFSFKKEREKESDIFSLTYINLRSFLRLTDFNNPYTILLYSVDYVVSFIRRLFYILRRWLIYFRGFIWILRSISRECSISFCR